MLKLSEKQTLTVYNKMELGEDISVEAKGKGRKFVSRFIEPGVAHYEEFGDVLITKETLNSFIHTMIGCPVIIQHKDIDDENADKERVGVISNVWFDEFDGWYYCDGIIWDKQAIDLIKNQGWSVSCTYDFDSDKLEKIHNGKKIDMEFTGGEFLHLALVPNPRYERANIVMNAKEKDNDIEWITVHGNHVPVKKGQSKDEAVKEFINKQQDKSSDKKDDKKESKSEESQYSEGRLKGEINTLEEEIEDMDDELRTLNDKLRKSERAIDKYSRDKARGYKEDIETLERKIKNKEAKLDKLYKEQESRKESSKDKSGDSEKEKETKTEDKKISKEKINKKYASNSTNVKEITMSVLNELESFIKGVIKNADDEDKKEEAKNEDKRKLIDEVGGILKGKVDDEIIKTIMKKMEEASYEPSEDKKADNEADEEEKEEKFEEEKKIANKCKNEEEKEKEKEEKEDKVEDEDDEKDEDDEVDKEEVKNKCKNSMKDVKEIIMGGKSKVESDYVSKADRFALGEKY